MIIIGILAAIAIPVFLSQRAKAQDSATKADVSVVGKELATHYVDSTAVPTVAIAGAAPNRTYVINGTTLGRVSDGVDSITLAASPTATTWCVQAANSDGTTVGTVVGTYKYSATGGLQQGVC